MQGAIFRGLFVFLCWLTIIGVSYRNTNIALLRGEAGWYQSSAHRSPAEQRKMERDFFTQSYKGHYLPLMYLSEYRFTKWAGMRDSIWRARQIAAASLLATCIFLAVSSLGALWRLHRPVRIGIATGVTALFIFQPHMTDLVAWPTMIQHFVWLILTTLTLWALVQFSIGANKARWLWLSVVCAYASMHVFGLGLVIAAATATVLLAFWLAVVSHKLDGFGPGAWHIGTALLVLVLLSSAHTLCMLLLSTETSTNPTTVPPLGLSPMLGLIAIYPFVLVANLFVTLVTLSTVQSISSAWPYGVIIVFASAGGILALGQSALRHPRRPIFLARFVLITFSLAAFFGCILLIAARQKPEPGADSFFVFLNVARYVVPITFSLAGLALVAILSGARHQPVLVMLLFVGLGFAAFIARRDYEMNAYSKAIANIPQATAWSLVLDMARESRAADLPIPNIPMYPLVLFDDWTLDSFDGLLHDELGLKPGERCQLIAWSECRGPARNDYDVKVPSLKKLSMMFGLESNTKP